jgi:hypothetical protein
MYRLHKIIIALIVLTASITCNGQVKHLTNTKTETPPEFYLRVKQFGEFIDRFNYISDWKGNPISKEFEEKFPRDQYIQFIINQEDDRLNNPNDSSYIKLCKEFTNYIVNPKQQIFINLFSGHIVAKAKANILYYGSAKVTYFEMIPEALPDRSAKWTIKSIDANFFKSIDDSLKTYFIAPNSHETNFINIRKLNGIENPIYYFSAISKDPTLLFLSELARNKIVIKNIESITYKISFTLWEIEVEEFNRTSTNSGWLISNIRRVEK